MTAERCEKHPHATDPYDCAECWSEDRIEEFAAWCEPAIRDRLRILMLDGDVEKAADDLARYAGEQMFKVYG